MRTELTTLELEVACSRQKQFGLRQVASDSRNWELTAHCSWPSVRAASEIQIFTIPKEEFTMRNKFLAVLFVFSLVLTGFAFAAELTPGELSALEAKQAAAKAAMETTSATPITEELVASADQAQVSADTTVATAPASPDVNGQPTVTVAEVLDKDALLARRIQELRTKFGFTVAEALEVIKANDAQVTVVVETKPTPKPETKAVVSADAPQTATVEVKVSADAKTSSSDQPVVLDTDEQIITTEQLVLIRTVEGGEEFVKMVVGTGKPTKADRKYVVAGTVPFKGVIDINGHSDGSPRNGTAFVQDKEIICGLMVASAKTITGLDARGRRTTIWLNACIAGRQGGIVNNVPGTFNIREFVDKRNVNFQEMSDFDWFDREKAWGGSRGKGGDPSYFCFIRIEKNGVFAVSFDEEGNEVKTLKLSDTNRLNVKAAIDNLYAKNPEFFSTYSVGLRPQLKDAKIAPKVAKKTRK